MGKQVRESIATWWKLTRYKVEIEPVSVVAFTEKTVTLIEDCWNGQIKENRYATSSEYFDFYPSWQEAHAALLKRFEQKEYNAQCTLEDVRNKLQTIRTMTPHPAPEGPPQEMR